MRILTGILLVALMLISGCSHTEHDIVSSIHIDEDNSDYNEFSVNDEKVYIRCSLTVTNTSPDVIEFSISGDFSEDKEGGLLTDDILYAYDLDLESNIFKIDNDQTKTFDVYFVGGYGGQFHKKDRLLPENIKIILNE